MLVKAKWNVKGSDGWHMTGEVFNTEEDFGDAVEVLDAPKAPEAKAPETQVPETKPETEPDEKPKQRTPRQPQRGRNGK